MIIRHLIEALLNPFFIVLLLFTWAIIRPSRLAVLVPLLLLLIISTGWLPKYLTNQLENRYQAVETFDPKVAWIVVLSGGQAELPGTTTANRVYSASLKRLFEGIRLLKMNPNARLLLSGGGYGNEKPEAERLHELAKWFNIPQQQLVIETQSLNTAGQAQAIKAWVHNQPFYLVTSAIHMPRAMALCQAQGLNPIPAPTDYTLYWYDERWQKTLIPNPQNMVYLSIAWHEILGIIWGKWHYWYHANR